MKLARRHLLAGAICLPLLPACRLGAAMAPHEPFAAGELWGMPYWARGAMPAVNTVRRRGKPPVAWHPDFI